MIKYSVIIPVYNAADTIEKCLDSIFSQNTSNSEIIIINDGSNDNSLDICQEYGKKYDNVIIINQKNNGPSYARNVGIKTSRGKYIIFIDADDYLSEDFFKVIDKHIVNNIDLLKFNINYHGNRIDEEIFNINSFPIMNGEKAIEMFLENNKIFATPWMYIYKRELFVKNNLFFSENHIHEDYGLIPCLIIKSKHVKGIDFYGYNYVYRTGSLSTNQDYSQVLRRAFDMLVQYDSLYEFSINNIKNKEIRSKFIHYIKNNLLIKATKINGKDLDEFVKKLKKKNMEITYE